MSKSLLTLQNLTVFPLKVIFLPTSLLISLQNNQHVALIVASVFVNRVSINAKEKKIPLT